MNKQTTAESIDFPASRASCAAKNTINLPRNSIITPVKIESIPELRCKSVGTLSLKSPAGKGKVNINSCFLFFVT